MSDVYRCLEDACMCCVCSLRDSEEFGEMAVNAWPGRRCGSLPPDHHEDRL